MQNAVILKHAKLIIQHERKCEYLHGKDTKYQADFQPHDPNVKGRVIMEQYKRLSDYRPLLPKLRVGGEIEAWCTRCRQIDNHTILAIQGNTPLKVMCNICRSQHNYRSGQSTSSGAKSTSPRKASAGHLTTSSPTYQSEKAWLDHTRGKDLSNPSMYHPGQSYEPGQVIQHVKFGKGIVVLVKEGNKMEVIFEDKLRLLVHSRSNHT